MAHLHELRMNAAANLLRNTAYKLDAIAPMVGLGCGFSLSRAFRRFYGVSPREFRNKNLSASRERTDGDGFAGDLIDHELQSPEMKNADRI